MNYRKCLISDLRENLDNGSITSEELFNGKQLVLLISIKNLITVL